MPPLYRIDPLHPSSVTIPSTRILDSYPLRILYSQLDDRGRACLAALHTVGTDWRRDCCILEETDDRFMLDVAATKVPSAPRQALLKRSSLYDYRIPKFIIFASLCLSVSS